MFVHHVAQNILTLVQCTVEGNTALFCKELILGSVLFFVLLLPNALSTSEPEALLTSQHMIHLNQPPKPILMLI